MQLDAIRYARAVFLREVIQPAEAPSQPGCPPVGHVQHADLLQHRHWTARRRLLGHHLPRIRLPERTLHEPVERTFSSWLARLEELIATAVELGQLVRDPAQLAFEIQALLNAGGHVFRLCQDPKAPERGRAAIRQRLEMLRGQACPRLDG